ncbi:hypothetical protein Vadar_032236 [Vaccinium darrowii]|uniref:Uncharacterized protein n=1 Tax=Vaccinium darrowii TaxID=229202 RepID=A0ACB7ZMY8_9ERIC|nr:hypothetical protein Vadar_032236 [Vaccinium darrowii]
MSPTGMHRYQGSPRPHTNYSLLFTNRILPFSFQSHCLSPSNLNPWRSRCSAVSPRRPPLADPEPPSSDGPEETFDRLQDTIHIFFAVLFWMSLFLWSSAWDGGNNGRPNKGSRFGR